MALVSVWPTALCVFTLLALVACGTGAPLPEGPETDPAMAAVDARAAALAASLVDGVTRDAMEEALLAAGFTIRSPGAATPLNAAHGGIGIALESFDVDALTLVTQKGTSMPYDDLVMALREGFAEYPDADFDAFILDGIRSGAQSKHPSLRFWARFIVELGKQGPYGYDFLAEVDTSTIRLTVLQSTLIGYRLLVDTYVAMQPHASPAALVRPATVTCTPEKIDEVITDLGVAGITAANAQLLAYWAKQGIAGAESAGKVIGAANLVFTYVKLAWTIIAFEGDILMSGYPYLPRTKLTSTSGETRPFAYTARYRIPDLSYLNCFRIMLAIAGLDFSFDDNKPIEGASANWKLLKGGATGATGGYSPGYIQWTQHAGTSVQQETNANGAAYINVSGKPQAETLPSRVREVHKPARIGVDVAIQSADIVKDLTGAIGGSLLTLPADLIMRTRWAFNTALSFVVIDWEKDDACGAAASTLDVGHLTTHGWTGRASFAYDFTFDDGSRRITQVISGDLEVDLVGDSQQLTYTGSPSGSASIAYHEYFYGPNGPALFQTVVGSGPLLPYAPPEGSRVLLHFGAPDCTFNVYVGAYIMATSTYHPYGGPRTGPVNIAKLKSGGVPLPSSGSLAGAGEYPAYSEFYLDRTPPWFSPWGASGAGGAALGSATVSWSFDRVPPATGP